MRIKKFIITYRILKILRKHRNERGTWALRYGIRRLKFVANAPQASRIIRGFIRSVEKEIN